MVNLGRIVLGKMLDLEKIDQIIKEMGGIEKFIPLLPVSIDDLVKYSKSKILDQLVPIQYWRAKVGLIGNGVTTFYCIRTEPPFPLKLHIDEKVKILRRAAMLLIEKNSTKPRHLT
jgi:hypothetical protein